MPPTIWARELAEIPPDLLLRWQRSTRLRTRLRMCPRSRIRRLRLCSSSIRCPEREWTICSRLIRRQKIASLLWNNSLRSRAKRPSDSRSRKCPRRVDLGVDAVPGAKQGCAVPGQHVGLAKVINRPDAYFRIWGKPDTRSLSLETGAQSRWAVRENEIRFRARLRFRQALPFRHR